MPFDMGKLSIDLVADQGVILRGLGGEALHGLIFRILKKYDTKLAFKLHDSAEQKPFSICPCLDGYVNKQSHIVFSPHAKVNFGISVLEENLLRAFTSVFISIIENSNKYSLSGKPVSLQKLDLSKGDFTSFSDLLLKARLNPKIALEFFTPTSFKRNNMQILFPEPELVFGSLLSRWNCFSTVKIDEEQAEFFPFIKVARYELLTSLLHFSNYKIIGFTGLIYYEVPANISEDFIRDVNALSDFACYSGVGVKTSMGMGQVKKIIQDK